MNEIPTTAAPPPPTPTDSAERDIKQALLYLRVSTMRQATKGGEVEGYSIPAQRRACTAKAHELGAAIAGEYVDAGASARSADRADLQAMLARIKQGGIDYVIVHKVDRLARSLPDHIEITMALKMAGATLVSVSEIIDDTPAGKLAHGMLASFAEYYSSNLANEARKGMLEKVHRGGTPTYAPIGYLNVLKRFEDRDGKAVELDPDRAADVAWIFQAYATGNWSISSIAEALDERGFRSRPTRKLAGTPLSGSQIHRLLTNPYYKGIVTYKGIQYDGNHPKLVDEATWQKIQEILAGRRIDGDRSWRHTNYLKGSLRCDRCGSRIGYGQSKGRGGIYDYYFCLGRHTGRNDCDLPYLAVDQVEREVENAWRSIHFTDDFIAAVHVAIQEALVSHLSDNTKLIAQQKRRIIRLDAQKQKLFDAYMADAMPVDELKTRQAKIALDLVNAQTIIENTTVHEEEIRTRVDAVVKLLRHARHVYISADEATRQQLNQAMFTALHVNAIPDKLPATPELAGAELTDVVDGTVATMTSLSMAKAATQPGLHTLGTLRARSPRNAPHTAPRAPQGGNFAASSGDAETPGWPSPTGGSNIAHLAVTVGFEPKRMPPSFRGFRGITRIPTLTLGQVRCAQTGSVLFSCGQNVGTDAESATGPDEDDSPGQCRNPTERPASAFRN